ncbi:hypothetical protein BpHYR1_027840, partial [Brachionus plicatilis]
SSDSGEYRCQVSNEHGEINRYFRIQVATIKKVATKSGELISLECRSENAECDKEINEQNDKMTRKMNHNQQMSNSLHHLSRRSIENSNYNLKRYSFVPMVTNSTPNNKCPDQITVVYSKNITPQNSIIVNIPKPVQFNYYPIYHLNSNQSSSLINHSILTKPVSQKSFHK